MAKLNQIIAIEKGIKSRVKAEQSRFYKMAQKEDLFNGFDKTYEKKDEDSEDLPADSKKIQAGAKELFEEFLGAFAELAEVVAKKDYSNTCALGDITIDGHVLISQAPATYLLFLEKELTAVRTFCHSLPTLDSIENWSFDDALQVYRTPETKTHRTRKVQKPIVLYDATDKHPAQTQLVTEDKLVGYWNMVKKSKAMTEAQRRRLIRRIDSLILAVKSAREQANLVEAPNNTKKIVGSLCDFLCKDLGTS